MSFNKNSEVKKEQQQNKEINNENDDLPYITLFSIHGLIRGKCPELGRDLDTGGQITYVLELARALSAHAQVDLFTRLIDDPSVSKEYAQAEEELTENKRAKIIRIPCGPKKYIRKELLWPFLPEFIDNSMEFILNNRKKPHVIHGHYADGSLVAAHLSDILGVPMAITGHSMGVTKLNNLLNDMSYNKIQDTYFIDKRIEAEERSLLSTNLVIANSDEEIKTQWRTLYNSFSLEKKKMWESVTLKPGVGMKSFRWNKNDPVPKIWKVIDKFFDNPNKPVILILARPAPEKNLTTMVEAYGESNELQEKANLVVIAGKRDKKTKLEPSQQETIQKISDLIEKYNISRKVAFPETHERDDVPALFALPAYRGGVFANIALREPFGLTLIEAAVNGSPLIATRNGAGPEIVQQLQNGVDVNPTNKKELCQAILKILDNKELWEQYHKNSLEKSQVYSWDGHVKHYLKYLNKIQKEVNIPSVFEQRESNLSKSFPTIKENEKLLIVDIDNTLLGSSDEAIKAFRNFVEIFRKTPHLKLAVATGRSVNSAIEYLSMFDNKLVNELQFLITSCGTEIHYFRNEKCPLSKEENNNFVQIKTLVYDQLYHEHLNYRFLRNEICSFIENEFPELEYQSEKTGHSPLEQRYFKLSYCLYEDRTSKSLGIGSSSSLSNRSSPYAQGDNFDDDNDDNDEEEKKEKVSLEDSSSPPNSPINEDIVQNAPPQSPPLTNNNNQNADENDANNNDLVILEDINNNNDVAPPNASNHNDVNQNDADNNDALDNSDAMSIRAPSMLSLSSAGSYYTLRQAGSSAGLAKLALNSNPSANSLQNIASYPSFSHLHTASLGNNINNNSNTLTSHDLTLKNFNKSLNHLNVNVNNLSPRLSASSPSLQEKRKVVKHRYHCHDGKDKNFSNNKSISELRETLRFNGYPCEVIISHDKFVDVLPIRASKGKAIRYLMARNNIKFDQIITAGDSGNDFDMLSGLNRSIIVGNYQQELKSLKHKNHVYIAHDKYANGIIEGLKHYQIIQ